MIPLPQLEVVGVFGPVASGKTHLVKQWLKDLNRFVAFDVTGEFSEGKDVEQIWASPSALHKRLQSNPYYFRIAYQPSGDIDEDFYWVYRAMWQVQTARYLAVDEFHLIAPVHNSNPDLQIILRFARHAQLGVIGVSQRLADVSKLFTSSCRMIVLFWTQEARDLEAIRERWGDEVAKAVRNLRPLIFNDVTKVTTQIPQCIVYSKGTGARIFDFKTGGFVSVSDRPTEHRDVPASGDGEDKEIDEETGDDDGEN